MEIRIKKIVLELKNFLFHIRDSSYILYFVLLYSKRTRTLKPSFGSVERGIADYSKAKEFGEKITVPYKMESGLS